MPLVLSQTVVPAESRTVVVMSSPADLLPAVRRAVRRRAHGKCKKRKPPDGRLSVFALFVFSELGLFRLDLGLLTVADGDDVVGDAGAAVDDGLLGGGCHVRRHDDVVEVEQLAAGLLNGQIGRAHV